MRHRLGWSLHALEEGHPSVLRSRTSSTSRNSVDFVIVGVIIMLLCLGIVMVYSASNVIAANKFDDPFFYPKRQLIWAILGIIAMFWFSRYDYHNLRKHASKIAIASFAMLVLVLIVGVNRGGSKAWLGIGSLGIQPSEFAKLGLIVFLAHMLCDAGERMQSFWRGFVPPLATAVAAVGLIMLEPDLGQSVVIMGTTLLMMFAAGTRMAHLGGFFGVGLLGFGGLVAAAPYRMQRVVAFLDPWKYPKDEGYQIIQSLYALGSGGILGLGLGNSRQKFMYLPEPQTDFIFSIIGEELGFLGGLSLLLLFGLLVWRGVRIAIYAPDEFGSLLGVGITGMIAVQVLINIGVVTGSMPATGITLPFISYGGSSLTLILSGVGILLNISKQAVFPHR